MIITMKIYCTLLLTVIAALTFASCKSSVDVNAENKKLLETDKKFSQTSVEKGSAEAFNLFLTDDALELPAGNLPVTGRENIYNEMKEGQHDYELSWAPQKAEAAKSGELGYTWGKYTIKFKDENGNEVLSRGKYLNIWKKQPNGEWKVAIDMGNKDPKPQADTTNSN